MQTTKYILEVTSIINKSTLTQNDIRKITNLLNLNSTNDLIFNIIKEAT